MTSKASIEVFSTCPYSSAVERERFLPNVVDVARWSEQAGCRGILVYTDNSTVDPWLVSQIIIQSTEALCPLVAVQPVYMHPYSVAKMVVSLGHLYGRRIYLNMVAGGFKNDLEALNDMTPHDRRYDRLIEYTSVIKELLASPLGVSYETFILDIPPNEEELHHIGVVFDLASKAAGVRLASKGVALGASKEQFM